MLIVILLYIKRMIFRTRNLVPLRTWSTNYIGLINQKNISLISPISYYNKMSNQTFRFDFHEENPGHIIIHEQIKKINLDLVEESIQIQLLLQNNNKIIEEIINVIKSPYFFEIRYNMLSEGKKINSRVISNSNYNSKNFEQNFNYYISKYNYLNKSDI